MAHRKPNLSYAVIAGALFVMVRATIVWSIFSTFIPNFL